MSLKTQKDEESKSTIIDCQLDTDMEILIPNHYVNSVTKRLKLYNDLASYKSVEELQTFKYNWQIVLEPFPPGNRMIRSVTLRYSELGFIDIFKK